MAQKSPRTPFSPNPSPNSHPTSGIGTRLTFLRTLLHSAVQQLRAKKEGEGLLSVEIQAGEADKFEQLVQERNLELPHLIRQLLLQEVYRGQRLAPYPNDQALAHVWGMPPHPHTLLRSLLYDEAWRLSIASQLG